MKNYRLLPTLIFALCTLAITPSIHCAFEGLAAFEKKCAAVPEFPKNFEQSLVSLQQFEATCAQHAANAKQQLTTQSPWIGGQVVNQAVHIDDKPLAIFDDKRVDPACAPFVQRVIVPHGTTIALFGDLHGSIHSLMRNLRTLQQRGYLDDMGKIVKPNFYIFFLGDFVDRGYYGVEVTYILMQLKIANPDKVFLVRGNHEDIGLNAKYGFSAELNHKFPDQAMIPTWYDLLPVALYLGSPQSAATTTCYDYVLCCHGGLEAGFDPRQLLDYTKKSALTNQLIGDLHRKHHIETLGDTLQQEVCKVIPEHECQDELPAKPGILGFLWSDFIIEDAACDNVVTTIGYTPGRGWIFGKPLTQALLTLNSTPTSHLRGVFRAHQHYGPMLDRLRQNHGMATLWNGLVTTFLSAPSVTQDLSSCGFGLLTTAPGYQKWRLELVSNQPNPLVKKR